MPSNKNKKPKKRRNPYPKKKYDSLDYASDLCDYLNKNKYSYVLICFQQARIKNNVYTKINYFPPEFKSVKSFEVSLDVLIDYPDCLNIGETKSKNKELNKILNSLKSLNIEYFLIMFKTVKRKPELELYYNLMNKDSLDSLGGAIFDEEEGLLAKIFSDLEDDDDEDDEEDKGF